MSKALYIHVGTPKTGTSAIQATMLANRRHLLAHGILYARTGCGSAGIHSELAQSLVPESEKLPGFYRGAPGRLWSKLAREAHSSPASTILISDERFGRMPPTRVKEYVPRDMPVQVVVYLRRQDELLQSQFNQGVKSAMRKTTTMRDELARVLDTNRGVDYLDYFNYLNGWSEAFGRENLHVRVFERGQMDGGLIADFMTCLPNGSNAAVGLKPAPDSASSNASFSPEILELVRLCNHVDWDAEMQRWLVRALRKQQDELNQPLRGQRLLSPQHRLQILETYRETNENVAREYFGRPQGGLFLDPWPDADEEWSDPCHIETEKAVRIMAELLKTMAEEHRTFTFRKLGRQLIRSLRPPRTRRR